jgi:7-cyano-7-deazaguanine synthase
MSIVTLVSGGIDSSLMAILAKREGIIQYPLFIDYGQLSREKELSSCRSVLHSHGLPEPVLMDLNGFGRIISSGITSRSKNIFADAFLPGRNLLFLLIGSVYAYQVGANAVAIGLLNEATHLFPDQTKEFLKMAENMISFSLGSTVKVIAPLMEFYKSDVLELALRYDVKGTYSCHGGLEEPCGICVSCKEILSAQGKED